MLEDLKLEISKLLWSYTEPTCPKKAKALEDFLRKKEIPTMAILTMFRHCEETHYNAINAVSFLTVQVIEKSRAA